MWVIVLKEQFGFEMARPDARDLLAWTMNTENTSQYLGASAGIKQELRGWLRQSVGSVGDTILDCLDAGFGEDAVPIGMVCQVVFNAAAEMPIKAELHSAAIRMERFVGGRSLTAAEAETWRNAAVSLIERLAEGKQKHTAMRVLDRTDVDFGRPQNRRIRMA